MPLCMPTAFLGPRAIGWTTLYFRMDKNATWYFLSSVWLSLLLSIQWYAALLRVREKKILPSSPSHLQTGLVIPFLTFNLISFQSGPNTLLGKLHWPAASAPGWPRPYQNMVGRDSKESTNRWTQTPEWVSCTVSRTPGDVAPATYAGRPSARGPGPARRRGRAPNRLGARLGNRIIISLIFRRVLLQLVFSPWLYISVIRTLRY